MISDKKACTLRSSIAKKPQKNSHRNAGPADEPLTKNPAGKRGFLKKLPAIPRFTGLNP
jgi:hypothetical protein